MLFTVILLIVEGTGRILLSCAGLYYSVLVNHVINIYLKCILLQPL